MIALWIAAALQSDWSEFRRERELTAEEVESLRDRLDAWGAERGVEAFRGFGRAVVIEKARELPLYQVRATTLEERRRLESERRPFDGTGTLVRAAGEVDLQGPALPPFSGFESREWRLPVEGSAQTLPCSGCRAAGRVECTRCRARRKVGCDRCRGSGNVECSSCGGSSKIRCSSCFGWGTSGTGSKRRGCSRCSGSGKRSCGSCSSGKVRCDPCRGDGKVNCGACGGKGDQECGTCRGRKTLVDTLEIVISLRPRVREAAVSLLPERWLTFAGSSEAAVYTAGEDAESRIARVPDPALADAARRALEQSKAAASGRSRGTQLRVRRIPFVLANLRWNALELDGEVAWSGDELRLEPSPATAWATREALRAESLRSSSPEEAKAVAGAALRADPECWRARRLLGAIENLEREERARIERAQWMSSIKQILFTALLVLAGLIAVTMLVLKIYLRRRRTS